MQSFGFVQKVNTTHGAVGGCFRSYLQRATEPIDESHQRKLVGCSDPTCSRRSSMKLRSLLYASARLISEAGSEPSTNFRWWDSRNRSALCVNFCAQLPLPLNLESSTQSVQFAVGKVGLPCSSSKDSKLNQPAS